VRDYRFADYFERKVLQKRPCLFADTDTLDCGAGGGD
jgi:hypothetical protein